MKLRHPDLAPLAILALAGVLLAAAPRSACALGSAGVGFKAGLVSPDHGDATAAIGANWVFKPVGLGLRLTPEFMYWQNNPVTDYNFNINALLPLPFSDSVKPYLGAGAAMHNYRVDEPGVDDDTDWGLNFIGGLDFKSTSQFNFFAEGRFASNTRDQVLLLAGVTFHLKGW
jgi:hypothetical protein